MKSRKRLIKKIIKKTISITVTLAVLGFISLVVFVVYLANQLPDFTALSSRRVSESTKIFDRSGDALLFDVHGDEKRTSIPWVKMPESVRNATLAAEDDDFYSHHGLDVRGIIRAVYVDVRNLDLAQGGSTITQQLIKNTLFGQEKTFVRKIKEAVFAIQVERKFTKDQIFWMYLNQIPYGSNIYGIEAASQAFFGKHAQELTNAEAAMLAALPKAPTYYSPHGSNVDRLMARKDFILTSMNRLEMITDDEYQEALDQELEILGIANTIEAPHFVIMVREYLIEKYGEDIVQKGGLRVITTLDFEMQEELEELVTTYGDRNEDIYNTGNMAAVAASPTTGQILAMVGSRDYFNVENEGNFNVSTAQRQPGSSFKPFAYATAFENGFPDSTVIFDVKTEFSPSCDPGGLQEYSTTGQKCYSPNNYSLTYTGPVTMRQALARSLNIPAVKTLYLAGVNNTINLATRLGISTLTDPSRYGLSLVLGGAEVKLVDMVSAYGVFANEGIRVDQTFILSVTTSDGRVLEEYKKDEQRVLSIQVSRLITDILSDNVSRAPVFGSNSMLHIPGVSVAGKTGTTQDNRDGWLVGYSPEIVFGVWGGNNDNSKMTSRATGASVAGPLWNAFMRKYAGNRRFNNPRPLLVSKEMLNGEYRTSRGIHNILQYVIKSSPLGSAPANPRSDSQFGNWEIAVHKWVAYFAPKPTITPFPSVTPGINLTPTPSPVILTQ